MSKLSDINVTLLFQALNLQVPLSGKASTSAPFCLISNSRFYSNFSENKIRPQSFVFIGGKTRQNKTNKTPLLLFDRNRVKPEGVIFLPLTFSNLIPPSFFFSYLLPNSLCICVDVSMCLSVCACMYMSTFIHVMKRNLSVQITCCCLQHDTASPFDFSVNKQRDPIKQDFSLPRVCSKIAEPRLAKNICNSQWKP